MKKNKAAKRSNLPDSRKTIRKQKRQEKKIKRREHYGKKKVVAEKATFTPGAFVKRPAEAVDTKDNAQNKKKKPQPSAQDLLSKEREKEIKEANKLKSQMESQRRMMLTKDNEDEDKMIKKLEKQLGLNKAKNKNKTFADDGLDYLLEICDRSTTEQIVAAEKHLATMEDESDFEEDLAMVTGKEKPKKTTKKSKGEGGSDDEQDSDIQEDVDFSGDDADSEDDIEGMSDEDPSEDEESNEDDDEGSEQSGSDDEVPKKDTAKSKSKPATAKTKETNAKSTNSNNTPSDDDEIANPFSDDEVSHLSDDFAKEIDDEDLKSDEKSKEKPDVWEDIYGRKRDKEGNVIKEEKGAYVPPHLRNKTSTTDKNLEALNRQVKSVLNKLTGTNLHWACASLERLYSSHPRHSVQQALCVQWLAGGAAREAAPARLQAELAALLAGLHANVAEDVGAFFLQTLADKFDGLVDNPGPMEDKQLDNVVACLSNLYNFKIYHAALLYDILNRLLQKLTEKNIECVLVALRVVGGALRKDDPSALKEFIQNTQKKVAEIQEKAASGSRIKFLLEVLLAVKNNNLTKIPNYDPSYTEELKKSVKALIRKGNYITPLNIRLEDLLQVHERGKWWVVGSAWQGKQTGRQPDAPPAAADGQLLELARAQRMNTDVRRTIFCVIMAAEDYMDAFEKLQHLGLKGQQEREIVHVLLACCLQEKVYNPYYSLLAKQMAQSDRRIQLSIQYSIWDKIKDLENLEKHSVGNLAQLLIHLIMEATLPLSVLKVIEFSDLNKSTVRFMRQILLAIIMNADFEASLQTFQRIASSAKLHMYRESLRLFIQHFLVRNAGKSAVLSEKEMAVLKDRAGQVEKVLTMHDSKMSF